MPETMPETMPDPELPPNPREYTVRVGDSLRLVALKHYGPGGHEYWKRIYDANKAAIGENPYILKPGTVLTIPDLDKEG